MQSSQYNITTFVSCQSGEKVGSMDFAMPSLREGMSIKMSSGIREYEFTVKSWEYIFGTESPNGLVVYVDVLNPNL